MNKTQQAFDELDARIDSYCNNLKNNEVLKVRKKEIEMKKSYRI